VEARATLNNLRVAPRKLRIVLDDVKKAPDAELALARLKLADKYAAKTLHKLLASAVANAGIKFGVNEPSRLRISEAFVNEGTMMRRFRPRAQGRATRIRKRTSHVTIVVTEIR
jgi:large subunit ribosomal protein L22